MPNHVRNILTTDPEVIAFLAGSVDQQIDFEKIIQTPEELMMAPSYTNDQLDIYETRDDLAPVEERIEQEHLEFDDRARLKQIYGFDNWHEWRLEHWGTKWNAYNIETHVDVAYFDTAWSMPGSFYHHLSQRFPQHELLIKWAEEDTGINFGQGSLKKGQWQRCDILEGTDTRVKRALLTELLGTNWDQPYDD